MIGAFIAVAGTEGYPAVTFAALARHAGLSSTRLISYHFASKDEVVEAVTQEILDRIGRVLDRPDAATSDGLTSVQQYVRAAVDLNRRLPHEMRALAQIFVHHRSASGVAALDDQRDSAASDRIVALLRAGQADGTIRPDLDPEVAGTVVQRSVDGLPLLLLQRPDLDLDHWAEEVCQIFRRAFDVG